MKKLYTILSIIFYAVAPIDAACPLVESGSTSSKALCQAIHQKMSSHILKQRLQRLPTTNLRTINRDIWKPRLQISDLYAAIPSKTTKAFKDFRLIVNYTALRQTRRQEYGVHFDICLDRSPHQFLLEGVLTTGDLRFEDGLNVRDIYGGVNVKFESIMNEIFPKNVLQHMLKGRSLEDLLEKDKISNELRWLEEAILETSIISDATIYNFNWMPVL
jgi:hypothetical protein